MMRRSSFLDVIDLFVDPDHFISVSENFSSIMVHNTKSERGVFASGVGSDRAALSSVFFVFLMLWCWDSEACVIVGAYKSMQDMFPNFLPRATKLFPPIQSWNMHVMNLHRTPKDSDLS